MSGNCKVGAIAREVRSKLANEKLMHNFLTGAVALRPPNTAQMNLKLFNYLLRQVPDLSSPPPSDLLNLALHSLKNATQVKTPVGFRQIILYHTDTCLYPHYGLVESDRRQIVFIAIPVTFSSVWLRVTEIYTCE